MTEYFNLAECGDLKFFNCDRLRARLSVPSCNKMWLEANDNGSDRHYKCRNCPLGAEHSGRATANLHPFKGELICARCSRGSIRLINRWLCVSCWNRQREWIIGKNAKGSKPTRMKPLHPRTITVIEKTHGPKNYSRQLTVSTTELVIGALRDCHHQVTFVYSGLAAAQFSLGANP